MERLTAIGQKRTLTSVGTSYNHCAEHTAIRRVHCVNQVWRMNYLPCPCCGFLTFECEYGSYDICQICGWEDDAVQLANPTSEGGANSSSLAQAQAISLNKHPPTVSLADGVRRGFGWRPLDSKDLEIADARRIVKHWHSVAVRWESETYWSGSASYSAQGANSCLPE